MGYRIKSLTSLLAFSSFSMGCEVGSTNYQEQSEISSQYEFVAETHVNSPTPPVETENPASTNDPEKENPNLEDKWWMDFPWEKSVKPLFFDKDGTPIPASVHPRSYYKIAGKTKQTTMEVHRQIARAVGLKVTEKHVPDLALFLSARSSIETSMQGNQRPFDNRGSVHSLDVRAAYKAGIRRRDSYVEAGNELAENSPWVFLGYGQGGMISWLFLDDWDILGDPRMLGDSVIGGLTYRRVLVKYHNMLSNTRIRCFEYNDEGSDKTLFFNDKSYRVGAHAVNEEDYQSCIEKGPQSKSERRDEEKLQRRCYLENRKTYSWKPGDPQPSNTVPVPEITWWQLKRASGGRPCPAWKGDTYAKHSEEKFAARAKLFDLDISKTVRLKELGEEPDGINQYQLWMQIWDATMESLGEKPINWENLREIGIEEAVPVLPTKEKIEEERRRARGEDIDPFKKKKSEPS